MCKVYFPKTQNIILQKKSLRHFVFGYDKKMSEYMSKFFVFIQINFLFTFVVTYVREMSEHMSKIIFLKIRFKKKKKRLLTYVREMSEHV